MTTVAPQKVEKPNRHLYVWTLWRSSYSNQTIVVLATSVKKAREEALAKLKRDKADNAENKKALKAKPGTIWSSVSVMFTEGE